MELTKNEHKALVDNAVITMQNQTIEFKTIHKYNPTVLDEM